MFSGCSMLNYVGTDHLYGHNLCMEKFPVTVMSSKMMHWHMLITLQKALQALQMIILKQEKEPEDTCQPENTCQPGINYSRNHYPSCVLPIPGTPPDMIIVNLENWQNLKFHCFFVVELKYSRKSSMEDTRIELMRL